MKRYIISCLLSVIVATGLSCKKDFLEKRPDKAIVVPEKAEDLQALLDNLSVMNLTPFYQVVGSDDLKISDAGFLALSKSLRNAYTWQENTFEGLTLTEDWLYPYRQVFYSNIVLDALKNKPEDGIYKLLKGQALFFRAHAVFQLSQVFAQPYRAATAVSVPGIPYPLSSDVNLRPGRKTLSFTYDQMLTDLETATQLLDNTSVIKSRPSKVAALALTARIQLIMSDFKKADKFAADALLINPELIDYNTLTARITSGSHPFPVVLPSGNVEVLFYTALPTNGYLISSTTSATVADPLLFSSYNDNDLRRPIFYVQRSDGRINFKGSYSGSITGSTFFAGLATDELYLIRAECHARQNNVPAAMELLNGLMIKRWLKGSFVPFTASTSEEALKLILTERRKELVTRGLRWSDLRRLNLEPALAVDLTRTVNGSTFTLEAGHSRYVLPIPNEEIAGSGIEQNY